MYNFSDLVKPWSVFWGALGQQGTQKGTQNSWKSQVMAFSCHPFGWQGHPASPWLGDSFCFPGGLKLCPNGVVSAACVYEIVQTLHELLFLLNALTQRNMTLGRSDTYRQEEIRSQAGGSEQNAKVTRNQWVRPGACSQSVPMSLYPVVYVLPPTCDKSRHVSATNFAKDYLRKRLGVEGGQLILSISIDRSPLIHYYLYTYYTHVYIIYI